MSEWLKVQLVKIVHKYLKKKWIYNKLPNFEMDCNMLVRLVLLRKYHIGEMCV